MADPTQQGAAGRASGSPSATDPTLPQPDPTPVEEILDGAEDAPAPEVPATDDDAPGKADGESAEAQLATALAERAHYLELAQRKAAEFENFRKRKTAEVAGAEARGVARVAKELLSALDHFDLALKSAAAGEGGASDVVKGFANIREEIVTSLGRVGVEPFSPAGEAFDPTEHEAMVSQPAEGAESGTVLEVYQSGYRINGSVLRPARVVVAA